MKKEYSRIQGATEAEDLLSFIRYLSFQHLLALDGKDLEGSLAGLAGR